MNSNNLANVQILFSDLSLKTNNKATTNSTPNQYISAQYKKSSQNPEINDLIRFQKAIMMKYVHTKDPHFKEMANALTPQIEDKIREFNNKIKY